MEHFLNVKTTDDDYVELDDIEPSQVLNEHSHLFATEAEIPPYSDLLNDEVFLSEVADGMLGQCTSPSQRPPETVANDKGSDEEKEVAEKEVAEKEDEVAADLYRLLKVSLFYI